MHIVPLYTTKQLRIVPGAYSGWTLQHRTYVLGIPVGWHDLKYASSLQELLDHADHLTLDKPLALARERT